MSPGAQTPTLLRQGERDNQEESALLSSWFRRAGGMVEVVIYPGEGHWSTAPAHRADFWRRTLAWFDQHVRACGNETPSRPSPIIPSKGYGPLPYTDAGHNPNLVRIYIDAQHDYPHDRIYLLARRARRLRSL